MFLPHDSGNGRFEVSQSDMIKGRLEKNIYYEMSHAQPWGEDNLQIAIKALGSENVIYGSSYPVKKSWLVGGPEMIQHLNISEDDKNKVLCENAKNVYNL
jgi:predicted TIM-barrel fold metal-dependent hydrolase